MEVEQFFELLRDFPSREALADMGVVGVLVAVLINQVEAFVAAMTWFL